MPSQGRVALCQDEACNPNVAEVSSGFGIHTVNASTRPFGDTNVDVIEATFDSRISSALGGLKRNYDAVMDFSTVLYADDLSTYLEAFDAADQDYLGLEWSDDEGTNRYSAIVQVPSTMVSGLYSRPTDPSGLGGLASGRENSHLSSVDVCLHDTVSNCYNTGHLRARIVHGPQHQHLEQPRHR